MKKHLIAAAVAAAVAVPAMAEVSLSGLLDVTPLSTGKATVGADNVKIEGFRYGGWSTPVFSIRANEDLGGGLKAALHVSTFYKSTARGIGDRETNLELSGGFGSIKFGSFVPAINGFGSYAAPGTNNTAGTADSGGFDLVAGTMGANQPLAATELTTARAVAGTLEYQENVMEYTTPTFSNLKATLTYINNSTDHSVNGSPGKLSTNQHGIRIDYSQGPLQVSLATGQRELKTEAATTKTEGDISWLGVSYNFGVARVVFARGQRKDKAAGATSSEVSVNNISLVVPLSGALTAHATMYDGDDKRTSTVAGDDRELKGNQVGLRYALSKRSFLYAVSGVNKNNIETGANATDTKFSQTSLGVVHSF